MQKPWLRRARGRYGTGWHRLQWDLANYLLATAIANAAKSFERSDRYLAPSKTGVTNTERVLNAVERRHRTRSHMGPKQHSRNARTSLPKSVHQGTKQQREYRRKPASVCTRSCDARSKDFFLSHSMCCNLYPRQHTSQQNSPARGGHSCALGRRPGRRPRPDPYIPRKRAPILSVAIRLSIEYLCARGEVRNELTAYEVQDPISRASADRSLFGQTDASAPGKTRWYCAGNVTAKKRNASVARRYPLGVERTG